MAKSIDGTQENWKTVESVLPFAVTKMNGKQLIIRISKGLFHPTFQIDFYMQT